MKQWNKQPASKELQDNFTREKRPASWTYPPERSLHYWCCCSAVQCLTAKQTGLS